MAAADSGVLFAPLHWHTLQLSPLQTHGRWEIKIYNEQMKGVTSHFCCWQHSGQSFKLPHLILKILPRCTYRHFFSSHHPRKEKESFFYSVIQLQKYKIWSVCPRSPLVTEHREGSCRTRMKRGVRPQPNCRGFASLRTPFRGRKRQGTDPFYGPPACEGNAAICLSCSRFWRLLKRGGTPRPPRSPFPGHSREGDRRPRSGGEPPAPRQARQREPQLALPAARPPGTPGPARGR